LRRLLFEKECIAAVKSMDSNKTPGTDGLTAEFSALNYAFESGCLFMTQRRSVIKVIPKKDAELYYIMKKPAPHNSFKYGL